MATFADDTAILAVDDTISGAINQLQNAINNINDYTIRWKTVLNETKSKTYKLHK